MDLNPKPALIANGIRDFETAEDSILSLPAANNVFVVTSASSRSSDSGRVVANPDRTAFLGIMSGSAVIRQELENPNAYNAQ
jgi:hypothetical protein